MIESPCVFVCSVDPLRQLCMGCFRTLEEIEEWYFCTEDEKQNILDKIAERKPKQ
jgi:predicted Fe-S protein YdhL (DUF1289 family)